MRSQLMQWLLNYTPDMFDYRTLARTSVTESLVRGRGIVWHEMERGLCGSFPDTTDNLLLDPDAESLRTCAYAIRIRRRPAWQVARDFGLDAARLKAAYDSRQNESRRETVLDDVGASDCITYYEVYSRMGTGARFLGASEELRRVAPMLEQAGEHVYLAILPGFGLLNLPEESLSDATTVEEIQTRLAWPIAFWGDYVDPWPFTCLDYYPHPRRCWPSPPLEPALPLQAFLDYAYSYVMTRLRSTARDLILTNKALEEPVRNAILYGEDQCVVPSESMSSEIDELVHILKFPPVNRDMYEVLALVERRFREATGLIELAYGNVQRQMRSASEAQVLQQNMSVRPEDLADCVENWHSRVASKEAIATRLYVDGETFAMLAGERTPEGAPAPGPLAQAWSALVTTQDPYDAASQMLYTVEAGSGRKKNLAKQQADITEAMNFMFGPSMQYYQATGDPTLINGLLDEWGESRQADVTRMRLPDRRMEMMQQQMAAQQQQQEPQPQPQAG